MGIEANTCEEIHINNLNEKTARFADEVGKYLAGTRGIRNLILEADDKRYVSGEDSIKEGSDLYDVCAGLGTAGAINIRLRSVNDRGLAWRQTSSFLCKLTDELKGLVSYRSTDYYDSDEAVDVCCFDENGFYEPVYRPVDADILRGIEKWYSYSPAVRISVDSTEGCADLHKEAAGLLRKLFTEGSGGIEDEFVELFDDDFDEYGEMTLSGSFSFDTGAIRTISETAGDLASAVAACDSARLDLDIYAVPDGENDYDFAVLHILAEGKTASVSALRF